MSNSLQLIDSHHHLWDFGQIRYPWLQEPPFTDRGWGDWSELRQNYLISDYLAEATSAGVTKSVHVQAGCHPLSALQETAWLQSVSEIEGCPNAVVAFLDLSAADTSTMILDHLAYPSLRGFRQVLNRHPNPVLNRAPKDYLSDHQWQKNTELIADHDLSFDVQIYPHQIAQVVDLARRHPSLRLIVDHCGMPIFNDAESMGLWRAGLAVLAGQSNVSMKLSGMGMLLTEWNDEVVRSTLDAVVSAFGPNRCLFGSNFPVDKLRIGFDDLVGSYLAALDFLSASELQDVFSGTARETYRMD